MVGGGISGATVAASLAHRGWYVTVLDQAAEPASGASGLPVGLFAPHVSPDDALLSRLTRAGVRATQTLARALLREGEDWAHTGVLEHGIKPAAREGRQLPARSMALMGSRQAEAAELSRAGLPPASPALWHAEAGWLKPAALVRALLALPGITWRGHAAVWQLRRSGDQWCVEDVQGAELARAGLVIVTAGPASRVLAHNRLPLQPLRGQIAWGHHAPQAPGLPPFPVNGHGSVMAHVPLHGGLAWLVGSTFERDSTDTAVRAADHAANLTRLGLLLPAAANVLRAGFEQGDVKGWAGVRATLPDRLPAVGPVDPDALPGLWVSTGMGSRGLTLAALCAEVLAACLHREKPSLETVLMSALNAARFNTKKR